MTERLYTVATAISIDAPAATLRRHLTAVDLAALHHPMDLALLGIPRPQRAELSATGIGGTRTAYFANGRRFLQQITAWQPPTYFAFTFHYALRARPRLLASLIEALMDVLLQRETRTRLRALRAYRADCER